MNFIQRNPNDPKHQEFHDGEYEFWPTDGSIKSKSISIPAALVSGLELLAATAAAGLLALAVGMILGAVFAETLLPALAAIIVFAIAMLAAIVALLIYRRCAFRR